LSSTLSYYLLALKKSFAPNFDYVIDINSSNVVIRDAYGNAAILNSVSDLNDWLKNVKGKKIRINANTVVVDNLYLTQNEYWIFGERIASNIYLREKNITIISFAPLTDYVTGTYVTNYDPDTRSYNIDVNGFKLFAVYANVDIESVPFTTVSDISIHVLSSSSIILDSVDGDVYLVGDDIKIYNSILRNAFIFASNTLIMDYVSGGTSDSPAQGVWCIVSQPSVVSFFIVSLDHVARAYISIRHAILTTLGANSSKTFDLLKFTQQTSTTRYVRYTVEAFGLLREAYAGVTKNINIRAVDPPPPGVTYSIDPSVQQVTITNSTSNAVSVMLVYRFEVFADDMYTYRW